MSSRSITRSVRRESIDNREVKRFLQDIVKILECAKHLASAEYATRNSFSLYLLSLFILPVYIYLIELLILYID
jgi:hypothetical protein